MRIPRVQQNVRTFDKKDIQVVDIPKEVFETKVEYFPDVDIDDDKSLRRYLKKMKSTIRTSQEYSKLMQFLKHNMNKNSCTFLPNVRQFKGSKIKIEQHHVGFTLEDIIETVIRKRVTLGERYDFLPVMEEVMLLHYQEKISIVPVCTTIHELLHPKEPREDGKDLFIPLGHDNIFGDMIIFFNEYEVYMNEKLRNQFKRYEKMSEQYSNIMEIMPDYLDVSILYYNVDGIDLPDMKMINDILSEVDIDS